ncbi:MAG: T9SS type A sorting domain-containing protein, partial [Flavobacteriaceae bacterium]|nr:T9SS type A sorting domain-containing protein [Flavobacteriaceae bacterium]
IRINDENNTFFPWKLDTTDITSPAIKGDNLVDNIEKIEVENPNGDYLITVSHKGTLESPQKVSLIVSGNGNLTLSRNNYELGDKKLLIYPTPATDLLYIRSLIEDAGIVSVKLMDLNSRVVYRLNQVDETLIQIPMYNLEKGIYFVSVEFKDYTLSKKITLQ